MSFSLIGSSFFCFYFPLFFFFFSFLPFFFFKQMGVDAERKRLEMAGATGAIEEAYRQGLTGHATRLNKVIIQQYYCISLYDVHTLVFTLFIHYLVSISSVFTINSPLLIPVRCYFNTPYS